MKNARSKVEANPRKGVYEASGASIDDDEIAAASFVTFKTELESTGLVSADIGVSVQGYDPGLESIAGLTTVADRMLYTTAADTYAVSALTSFARSLLDDSSAAAARSTLGVDASGTDNSTDVTLVTTSHDYLSIAGQAITLGAIDLSTDVIGTLPGSAVSETGIDHDALDNFVANEHIDWTSTSANLSTSGTAATGALTVTGNITVTGTVDGVDIAARDGNLATVESNYLSTSAAASTYQPLDANLTTWAGITPGTGVGTALAVNVGTAGSFVVNGGALGTPSSGTLTNATGLPISTGVSGLGTGVATFLATPTSANLSSAVSDDDVVFVSDVREKLTANRTYYVRTDGSDSNTGLTNSSGGAFLTIQKALNVANGLDNDIYSVTIQIGNGTYNEALTVAPLLNGSQYLVIQGDTTTPSNVVINSTGTAFDCAGSGLVQIRGVKIISSVHGIKADSGIRVWYGLMEFGAITTHGILCRGASVYCDGNYTINGNSYTHICADTSGAECSTFGYTVTLSGTPAFTYFALIGAPSKLNAASTTFSGSATGTRYYAYQNAIIYTNGGGASYLPGNVAGSTATGGQYL